MIQKLRKLSPMLQSGRNLPREGASSHLREQPGRKKKCFTMIENKNSFVISKWIIIETDNRFFTSGSGKTTGY
jgi:hypothetical protein